MIRTSNSKPLKHDDAIIQMSSEVETEKECRCGNFVIMTYNLGMKMMPAVITAMIAITNTAAAEMSLMYLMA